MQRDSFIFYKSFYEGIKELPRDIQGEVLTAIMEYGINGSTTDNLKPIARAIFTLIKPQLDANNKRFENGKKGAEFGKLGGRPKPQRNPKETPNVNVNVNVNDNEKNSISGSAIADKPKPFTKFSEIEFYNSLKPFLKTFDKQLIREFYDYWREPTADGKMRFQKEKAWEIGRRIGTWKKNNFNKKTTETPINTDRNEL